MLEGLYVKGAVLERLCVNRVVLERLYVKEAVLEGLRYFKSPAVLIDLRSNTY